MAVICRLELAELSYAFRLCYCIVSVCYAAFICYATFSLYFIFLCAAFWHSLMYRFALGISFWASVPAIYIAIASPSSIFS